MHSDWDDDLSILSAENVNFGIETAGLGTRFAAAVIDMTLQFLTVSLLVIAAFSLSLQVPDGDWVRVALSLGGAMLILLIFVIVVIGPFLFEWLMDGQTPGKRWLGLRVMQTSGMPLTVWPALTRNMMRFVDFLPVFYGVGALVAVLNSHNRRVGDLVAGTLVARERGGSARRLVLDIDQAADAVMADTVLKEAVLAGDTGRRATAVRTADAASVAGAAASGTRTAEAQPGGSPAVDATTAALQVRLDEQDYELIREFLLRRGSLQPEARWRLGRSLAERLGRKLGQAAPPDEAVEPLLEQVANALKNRGG